MTNASPARPIHLGVDLSDAGAHPAVWRTQGTSGQRPFDPERLAALVATAQRGVLDFVLFDDAFSLQPRNETRPGRLDAALISARAAPPSSGIGIIATIDTSHTEPFHVSKAIATVDTVSQGRAAWQVGVSTSEAAAEADEAIEAVTRLWDSGEDDAEIPDVPTGRSVDRDKQYYVDLDGVHFAVKGPSTAPRPPQGRPPVVVRAGSEPELRLAGRRADLVRIRATDLAAAGQAAADVRREAARWGRDPDDLRILLDVYAIIGRDPAAAAERRSLLESLDDSSVDAGSLVHVGTPEDLARVLLEGVVSGAVDGYTVRPASLETDLHGLVDGVLPFLQQDGAFRRGYPGVTLRDTLGLRRPANSYAAIA